MENLSFEILYGIATLLMLYIGISVFTVLMKNYSRNKFSLDLNSSNSVYIIIGSIIISSAISLASNYLDVKSLLYIQSHNGNELELLALLKPISVYFAFFILVTFLSIIVAKLITQSILTKNRFELLLKEDDLRVSLLFSIALIAFNLIGASVSGSLFIDYLQSISPKVF